MFPLLRHMGDELGAWLVPLFDEALELEPDLDAVPALTLRREKTWTRLQAADFLTLNEKRAEVGFAPISAGDVLPAPRGATRAEEKIIPDSG